MARPNNSQVRPVKTDLQVQNRYTKRRFMPAPMTVVRGTVLTAYQGLQFYDVATDVGRYNAIYLGISRGLLGAMESSGFMPGQQVLVAVAPGEPNFQAFILGAAGYPVNGDYTTPQDLLVYPQVAGFDSGAGMSGAAYAKYPRLRNFNSGLTDVVDGDWIVHNRLGGAMGVEAFRVFLQGGPAAGVFAYGDDNHLRIVGQKFERYTFGEEYDDKQSGPTINYIGRRVGYPSDALTEKQPQRMDVGGGAYFGHHIFEGPIDASSPGAEFTRPALLHEYRGGDGTYILTSAKSIVLQKWIGLVMPAEKRLNPPVPPVPPAETSEPLPDCAPCTLTADLKAQPEATGASYRAVAAGQLLASLSSSQTGTTVGGVRYVDELINQAFYGFRNLPAKWNTAPVLKTDTGGVDSNRTYFVDAHMWKGLPKSFLIEVTPFGGVQRYQLGRAMICILEDGSLMFQEAGGAQLTLGGGNIYMTAEHDIIAVAGRNRIDIAGRDAAYRADRHIDMNATTGRLTAVAGNQATLVGGVDGQGGVLIESLGQYAQTNQNAPSVSGAVVIKANHQVGISAGNVTIDAQPNGWSANKPGAGLINLRASSQVAWKAGTSWGVFGANAFFNFAGARIVLGPTCIMPKLAVKEGFLYKRLAYVGDTTTQYDQLMLQMTDGAERVLNQADAAASPLKKAFTAKWLTSAQHTLPTTGVFNLPLPDWQQKVKDQTAKQSVLQQTKMGDNEMNGGSVFPGKELAALAIPAYNAPAATTTGGTPLVSVVGGNSPPEGQLTVSFTFVPIKGNLLKGI